MATVQRCWMRLGKELGLGALMLTLVSGVCNAAAPAAVSGIVRDTQGVAQMGALVEVLAAASSVSVATALTDINGRYRIANLVPGKYQVRATAALYVPATRSNLQLSTGMRATVNLTLSTLADPAAWLPARRRGVDEPSDDWTWTLRSAANRPILRLLDDGDVVLVSDGSKETGHKAPVKARAAVSGGDGDFGQGGVKSAIVVDRAAGASSDVVLRAGISGADATEAAAGYERKAALGNASRAVVSYASHPEMVGTNAAGGLQVLRMASGEKMQFGDLMDAEAGGTVYAIHMAGTALTGKPFVRVTVHPGEVWAVRYRLATSREMQGFDAMDSVATDLPVATMKGGQMVTEDGVHNEIAVSRKLGSGELAAAVYHDDVQHPEIGGLGAVDQTDLGSANGVVLDTATGTFRFLGAGYSTDGLSVTLSQPLGPSVWAAVEYARGGAMAAGNGANDSWKEVASGLHTEVADAVAAALNARVQRSGTKISAEYHWQPKKLVTAVNAYDPMSDQAFLSFYVRQAVRWGNKLPSGLEATVDVTNLLAEGYQPFVSADGRTLYLAQTPMTIRGGLSFAF